MVPGQLADTTLLPASRQMLTVLRYNLEADFSYKQILVNTETGI